MNDKLTVACVYKQEVESPYTPEYVSKLMSGVRRHLTIPHRRVCLTDVPVSQPMFEPELFEQRSLRRNYRAWWSKLNLFELPGPVLFFDLDTVIVGSLDSLARAVIENDGLTVLRGFYRPFAVNSGVMGWNALNAGSCILAAAVEKDIFDPPQYSRDARRPRMITHSGRHKGDQDWLDAIIRTNDIVFRFAQKIAPGSICSYKVDIRDQQRNAPPNGTSVVCFHGRPRPHMVANLPWMQEHWKV